MSAPVSHTPGPWEGIRGNYQHDRLRCFVIAKGDNSSYMVATIEHGAPGDIYDTELANARIMAAAPEMLKACEAAFDFLGGDDDAIEIRHKLMEAIAKAKDGAA